MKFSSATTTIIRLFVVATCIAFSGAAITDDVSSAVTTAGDAISNGVNTAVNATENAAQTATAAIAGAADTAAESTNEFVENQQGETTVEADDESAAAFMDTNNKGWTSIMIGLGFAATIVSMIYE